MAYIHATQVPIGLNVIALNIYSSMFSAHCSRLFVVHFVSFHFSIDVLILFCFVLYSCILVLWWLLVLLFSCISSNNRNDFHVSMACYAFISRRQNYTPMNCFCSILDKTNRILAIRRMCRGVCLVSAVGRMKSRTNYTS